MKVIKETVHKDATHPRTPKQTTKFEINYGLQERVGEVKRFMETISEIEIPVFLHAQKYERIKNRIASIIHIIKEKTEHIFIPALHEACTCDLDS